MSRGLLTPRVGRAGEGNGHKRSRGVRPPSSAWDLLEVVSHDCFSAGSSSFSGKSFLAPKFQLYGAL